MDTPLFSIISVSRNNLPGLQATARSLPAAAPALYEWIVIDGASTDGSREFLQQSAARWICEPDSGIYDAMNKGLALAKGVYVLFLNAGDVLSPPATLETLATVLAPRPVQPDFIYGDSREAGHYKPSRPHNSIVSGMFTHHQAMFYKRDSIKDLRFDTQYKIAADYKFTAAFLKNTKDTFYWPRPVCVFEQGGMSQKNMRLGRIEQFSVRQQTGICPLPVNAGIFLLQTGLSTLRKTAPALYWKLKMRSAA